MAKNNGKGKAKKPANAPRRRTRQRRARGPALSAKELNLAQLLADPCNANAPTGLYSGEIGIVERFIQENTMVSSGNTAAYQIYHPNTGWIQFSNVATSAVASASTFTNATAPGTTFLTTNAQKVRGLAACMQVVCSSLSITAITGEVAVGVLSCDTLKKNGTISVDTLFSLLQGRAALTRDIKEVKWFPGLRDNSYSTYTAGATEAIWDTSGSDFSDTNVLVVAIRNVPLGTVVNVRITGVLEWTPKPVLGLVPKTGGAAGGNHMAASQALHQTNPSWWNNLAHSAGTMAAAMGSQYMAAFGKSTGEGLTQYITRSAPSYITMAEESAPLLLTL